MPTFCVNGCTKRVSYKDWLCSKCAKERDLPRDHFATVKTGSLKAAQTKYFASAKGKAAKRKHNDSEAGKESRKKYFASEKGKKVKAARRNYNASEAGKEARKQYYFDVLKPKATARARAEYEQYIQNVASVDEAILTDSKAAARAEKITALSTFPSPDTYSIYVGYTRRAVKDEELRWITARTVSPVDKHGKRDYKVVRKVTPILTWPDGSTITQNQARQQLKFRSIRVYESTLKFNARMVEDAIQKKFMKLHKGSQRLWRCLDRGAKYDTPDDHGKVHKVFVCFSDVAPVWLSEGRIKANVH